MGKQSEHLSGTRKIKYRSPSPSLGVYENKCHIDTVKMRKFSLCLPLDKAWLCQRVLESGVAFLTEDRMGRPVASKWAWLP